LLLKYYILSNFKDLGIHQELIKALNELNINTPTVIQTQAIPVLLKGKTDFIGQAQTGTGKTAAFGLPLLQLVNPEKKNIQAVIICPTRELGQQIAKQLFKFTKYVSKKIFVEAVYGGEKIDIQIGRLKRPTQILVATPGRLIDLLERKAVDLMEVKNIVLDEADEMLSMGFKQDIDKILSHTAQIDRNIWLFSATIPSAIKQIISDYMADDAYKIEVDHKDVMNTAIKHQYVICDIKDKPNFLQSFIKNNDGKRGIVFCKTKAGAQTLAKQLLAKNLKVEAIHGDLGQRDREKVMRAFKSERLQVLIATDISARGIDVSNLSYVIHYQLPEQLEYFTHRSGRTARAGNKGLSLAFVAPSELEKITALEKELNIYFEKISI
jgi:ATP-dependent RNA helicase DeaD